MALFPTARPGMQARRFAAACLLGFLLAAPVRAGRESSQDIAASAERLVEARRLSDAARYEPARRILDELLARALEAGDPRLEADAHLQLGANLFAKGLYDQAQAEYERALQAALRAGDRGRERHAREGVARTFVFRTQGPAYVDSLRILAEEARQSGDRELRALALADLGMYYANGGEPDSARAVLETALEIVRQARLVQVESNVLQELGMALFQLGEQERGLAFETEALGIARAHGLRREELSALTRSGRLHAELEQYSAALAALGEARPIAEEIGALRAVANIRLAMGDVDLDLGRIEDALAEYEAALAVVRPMRAARFEAIILRRIARARTELGQPDAARDALEAAAQILERAGMPRELPGVLHDLGLVQQKWGNLVLAEQHFEQALSMVQAQRRPITSGDLECHLGEVARLRGDRGRAAARLDAAGRIAESSGRQDLLRDVLEQKANLQREAGDLAAADSLLRLAIDIAEGMRGRLSGDEIRVAFHETSHALYVARVAVLYQRGVAEGSASAAHAEAFRVAERSRARALLDVLGGIHLDPGARVGRALREREQALSRRLGLLQAQLSKAAAEERGEPARSDSLQRALALASREHREASLEIASQAPGYGELLGFRTPLGIEDVRARVLLPGQVLLEYLVGRDETYLFLLGSDVLRVCRIPAGADTLEARVTALREAIRSGAASLPEQAARLYDLVLGAVAADLQDAARLLVVADGPLHHLPFAVLRDARGFLVEQHAIAYAPSASVLDPRLRGRRRAYPREPTLLAVGNPATYREGELLAVARTAQGWRFGELPYSEEEVRRIAGHFRHPRILTGAAAREEAVKSGIGRATCLHFATHGLLDEQEPMQSGLALAQDEDPNEDGFLQVREILGLDLSDADLVVLSACNTGLGRMSGGEGVLGLSRAFLHAGARQLVLSLWEVGDRSTVDLMQRFYAERFASGLATDLALREAQVALLARGFPARDWGAFAPTGLMSAPRPGGERRGPWLLAGAGLAVLLCVAFAIRFRRSSARTAPVSR